MEQSVMWEAVDRIRQMELCFDTLQKAVNADPAVICEDASLKEMLGILAQYYEGGQWLQDYTLDEQGFLPEDLKRGVLSQDAVYDLLSRIPCID